MNEQVAKFARLRLWHVAAIALVWSLLLIACFSPGLSITDSGARALTAAFYAYDANVPIWARDHWFPPAMAMFMGAVLRCTGSFAPYTLLMCWWFYAATGALLSRLVLRGWALAGMALLMFYPPIWNHAISILPDAPTAAAICTILTCAFWAREHASSADRRHCRTTIPALTLAIGSFSLACIVLFSFRANSITLAPVVAGIVVWAWRPWRRALAVLLIVVASIVYAKSLKDIVPLRKRDMLAASLIWEYVGMLKLNNGEAVAREHTITPLLAKPVADPLEANASAINVHDWYTHDSMIWSPSPFHSELILDPHGKVRQMHRNFVRDEPLLYMRTKLEIWQSLLGLRGKVPIPFVNDWVPPSPLCTVPAWPTTARLPSTPCPCFGSCSRRTNCSDG